jgi:putative endonuclease
MRFKVYVLFSPVHSKIYIGYTSDLEARLLSHNTLAAKGWTIKFRPWTLVHQEAFDSKKEATARKKKIEVFTRKEMGPNKHSHSTALAVGSGVELISVG